MLKTNLIEFENDIFETITAFAPIESVFVEVDLKAKENEITVFGSVDGCDFSKTYILSYNDKLEEKRLKKRAVKLALYDALKQRFNRELLWGALTGIRPTKLAYMQKEKSGEFFEFFSKQMQVSFLKTKLIDDILKAQQPYYEKNQDNCDLFVGIPFCPSRCLYCSFLSSEIAKVKQLDEYISCLIKEIHQAKKLIKNLRSVYVGGGTPVSLSSKQLSAVLDAIGKVECEYTVEAGRPDCLNAENLAIMKEHGVTRICVNPQTFCDQTLKLLSRKHTANDVIEKFLLAKQFGFEINMDLIAGLPGENFEIFSNSLNKAIELNADNITVHTLALKRGSILKEKCSQLDEGDVIEMVDFAHRALSQAGYTPYYLYRQKYMAGNLENTGYSKPGKECVYNIDIMEEITQIIACGANAVSKRLFLGENRIERYGAPKDVATYIAKVDEIIQKKQELFSL